MVINEEQAIRMPQKGNNILKFQNYHKQMPVPLLYMVILRPLLKRYKDANLIALNLIPINTKNTLAAVTGAKLYAVIMINIQNQRKFTEERILLRSLCRRCS